MKLRALIDAYNEGGHKVIVIFGYKLHIRSKVLMLRKQMKENRRKCDFLEKQIKEEQKSFEEYLKKIEQQLAELKDREQARHDSMVKSMVSVRQEMKLHTTQLAESIHGNSVRLTELEQLGLDSRCASNSAAAQVVSERLAALEQLGLDKVCRKSEQTTAAVEQLLSEWEQLKLDQKLNQLQTALLKTDEQVSGIQKRISPLANQKIFNFLRAQGFSSINRDYVASLVENYSGRGVSGREGTPELVVSLTSYPARMYDIHLTLYSLLTQDLKPDKIILWLGEEQFPRKRDDVPRRVRDLERWGVDIKWCADTKSYKKLLPTLQEYPESVIVTADDDIYYPQHWLKELWETHRKTGARIVAHRCHRVACNGEGLAPYSSWKKCVRGYEASYLNFMTGAGGVLYAPGSLHEDVFNVAKAMELCPHNDDIWFWAAALLNGTRISLTETPFSSLIYTNPEREANANDDGTLFAYNGSGGNDIQLKTVVQAYPQIMEIVRFAAAEK